MSVVKAFYHNGIIDFIETPPRKDAASVLVVFPDKTSEVRSLRGAVKPSKPIDYQQIAADRHQLSRESEMHICEDIPGDEDSSE